MFHLYKEKVLCSGPEEWPDGGSNAATLFATTEGEDYVVSLEYNDTHENVFYLNFGSGPSAFHMASEFFEAVANYLLIIINNFRTVVDFTHIVADATLLSNNWQLLSLVELNESTLAQEFTHITHIISMYR